jgi:hypothetical protein
MRAAIKRASEGEALMLHGELWQRFVIDYAMRNLLSRAANLKTKIVTRDGQHALRIRGHRQRFPQ